MQFLFVHSVTSILADNVLVIPVTNAGAEEMDFS